MGARSDKNVVCPGGRTVVSDTGAALGAVRIRGMDRRVNQLGRGFTVVIGDVNGGDEDDNEEEEVV